MSDPGEELDYGDSDNSQDRLSFSAGSAGLPSGASADPQANTGDQQAEEVTSIPVDASGAAPASQEDQPGPPQEAGGAAAEAMNGTRRPTGFSAPHVHIPPPTTRSGQGPRSAGTGLPNHGGRGREGLRQVRGPRVSQFSGPPRGPGTGRGPQLQQWGQAAQALNPAQQQQLLQYGSAQLAQGASLDQQQRQQLQWMLQSLNNGGMGQNVSNGRMGLQAPQGPGIPGPPGGPSGLPVGMWANAGHNQPPRPPPGPACHLSMNGGPTRATAGPMLGGMGTGMLPLPPNFEKLLQQGGLGGLPLPPGMTNGSLSSGSSMSSSKRPLPPDAQVMGGPPSSKPRLDGSLPLPPGHPRAWSTAGNRPLPLIDGRPMLAGEEDALGSPHGKRRPSSRQQRTTAGAQPPPHAMPPDWEDQARPATLGGVSALTALGKPDKFLQEQAAVVQREEAQAEAERRKQEVQAKIEAQRQENRRIVEEHKQKQLQQQEAEKAAEEGRKKKAEIALMKRRIAQLEAQTGKAKPDSNLPRIEQKQLPSAAARSTSLLPNEPSSTIESAAHTASLPVLAAARAVQENAGPPSATSQLHSTSNGLSPAPILTSLPSSDLPALEEETVPPAQSDQQPGKDKHRHRSKSKHKHKATTEKEGKEHRKKRKHRSHSRSEAPQPDSDIKEHAQDAAPAAAQELPMEDPQGKQVPLGTAVPVTDSQLSIEAAARVPDLRERLIAVRKAKEAAAAASRAPAAGPLRSVVSHPGEDVPKSSLPGSLLDDHAFGRDDSIPAAAAQHDKGRSKSRHQHRSSKSTHHRHESQGRSSQAAERHPRR
ncbi:hypothetical protein WJX74_001150 [Apatococcus lobatus]|uniref:Uncharacterized protein n=1 Tax=Apatococcus lobatus TaxID=904363 RepID=A0AAW1RUY3_9CHLO